jgi:hypothetical protein
MVARSLIVVVKQVRQQRSGLLIQIALLGNAQMRSRRMCILCSCSGLGPCLERGRGRLGLLKLPLGWSVCPHATFRGRPGSRLVVCKTDTD